MAERRLKVADGLSLPLEAVTEPLGILAARRAGKSNAAVVIAEQMFDAGLHWVAIDPKGDWWGIRSDAAGKKDGGLPIPIFGGAHRDVPLEPGSGALIADLVIDERLTCVLDVSGFGSEADKIRFLLAFGDRLFRRKEPGQEPTHVFFEEADDYAPQRAFPEQARLVHTMARILKQGGARGLGGTVISQRSAVVHKDLLSQIQTLFALRTTGPQDRKAIKDWVSFSGENPQIVEDLPGLADGEAWVWSPNWLRETKRIRFHRRRTFDSGATPKVGASKRPPATLADVDLGALTERMAETIERAKADDPKELRRRIAALEREAQQRPTEQVTETVVEYVDRPVLNGQVDKLAAIAEDLRGIGSRIADVGQEIVSAIVSVRQSATPSGRVEQEPRGVARPGREARGSGIGTAPSTAVATPALAAPRREPAPSASATDVTIGKGERTILTAVAQYPAGAARDQLSVLTGYKRSSRDTYLQRLSSAGYVEVSGGLVRATDAGIAALGSNYEPLPTGVALQDYWREKLPEGERRVLDVLVAAYPDAVRREQIDEETGYKRSSRDTYLQRLRSRRLVENVGPAEVRASEDLF